MHIYNKEGHKLFLAQLLRGGLKRSSLPASITVNDLIKHYCLDSQVLGDHNENGLKICYITLYTWGAYRDASPSLIIH